MLCGIFQPVLSNSRFSQGLRLQPCQLDLENTFHWIKLRKLEPPIQPPIQPRQVNELLHCLTFHVNNFYTINDTVAIISFITNCCFNLCCAAILAFPLKVWTRLVQQSQHSSSSNLPWKCHRFYQRRRDCRVHQQLKYRQTRKLNLLSWTHRRRSSCLMLLCQRSPRTLSTGCSGWFYLKREKLEIFKDSNVEASTHR